MSENNYDKTDRQNLTKTREAEKNSDRNCNCGCRTEPCNTDRRTDACRTDNSEKINYREIAKSYQTEYKQDLNQTEKDNAMISESELQEVYRNASTGKESIEIIKSFSSNKGFRNMLIRQYKEYSSIAKEIELYANQLGYDVEKTTIFAKGMMYMTTAINTLTDKSDSKLSEIMIQGINMGIIALTKLNNKLAEDNRSCKLSDALLDLLMKNLEEMKLFL